MFEVQIIIYGVKIFVRGNDMGKFKSDWAVATKWEKQRWALVWLGVCLFGGLGIYWALQIASYEGGAQWPCMLRAFGATLIMVAISRINTAPKGVADETTNQA